MDKQEAKRILQAELEPFRAKPYAELVETIGAEPATAEHTGPSGTEYQIEIEAIWARDPHGDVMVIGAVAHGRGWSAYSPLCDDFIKSPSGEFLWE